MKFFRFFCWSLLPLSLQMCQIQEKPQPFLSLHTDNPHYFLFRGEPAILIGSTEHYGAVMNLDFDYLKYLNAIASSGLNVTRTFSGIYVEPQGAFGIERNTLAPAPGRYICPWARSSQPGYANGGNKFDLSAWDEDYFSRLKDFLTRASGLNVIVEFDLFSNFYGTEQWKLSPLYSENNINGIGNIQDQKEILSLSHPDIIDIQEKMVRKIVKELKNFDNLYYEICNEPYFGDTLALREWEKHMTGVVADAEKDFKNKHLISNNIANHYRLVPDPRPYVSVYNFHYARPPLTVGLNYHLNMVIGDNETGFDGIQDSKYRSEAWNFILAGGSLFNNLDYSFTTGNEDGSFIVKKGQPGGGGKALRFQLKILAEFMKSLDYIKMVQVDVKRLRTEEQDLSIRALARNDDQWALYLQRIDTTNKSSDFEIDLSPGSYSFTWIDTRSAEVNTEELKDHPGGRVKISSPAFSEDLALKLLKTK